MSLAAARSDCQGVLLISLFLLEALSEPGSVAFSIFMRRRVHLVCDRSFLSCSSI